MAIGSVYASPLPGGRSGSTGARGPEGKKDNVDCVTWNSHVSYKSAALGNTRLEVQVVSTELKIMKNIEIYLLPFDVGDLGSSYYTKSFLPGLQPMIE